MTLLELLDEASAPLARPEPASPGNPFTYPAWDLLTMEELDALPYVGVSFGEEVNRPGSWAGQLPIGDPRVQQLDYLGSNETGRTALFVDFNGTLEWGGIIWTRRYKESRQTLTIGAMEFGSYFAERLQAKDYAKTWEGAEHTEDPMVIAKTILEDAQNRPPEVDVAPAKIVGGIAVVINGGPAPAIEATYPGTQLQTVESIVSTLSQMGYTAGFDYSFDVAYVSGTKTPAVTLNFWYPRQGRLAADSGLIVLARDCLDWDWDEDSTRQATSVTETGTGSGGLQPATSSAAPPGYPLLEKAVSHSQVSNEGVLSNIALGDLALSVFPVTTPALILPVRVPGPEASERGIAFGDFRLGDDLAFRVEPQNGPGLNKSPRFPNGCAFDWRITNWVCAVADQGISTITFNLTIPPINEVPPPAPPLK
jgi:hypothetical protein